MAENRQSELSVTWTKRYIAFLICAMCACAEAMPLMCTWTTSDVLLEKEVGFWGYFYQGEVGKGRVKGISQIVVHGW